MAARGLPDCTGGTGLRPLQGQEGNGREIPAMVCNIERPSHLSGVDTVETRRARVDRVAAVDCLDIPSWHFSHKPRAKMDRCFPTLPKAT